MKCSCRRGKRLQSLVHTPRSAYRSWWVDTYEKFLRPLHGRVWVKREFGDDLSAKEIRARIAQAVAAGRCPRCDTCMEPVAHQGVSNGADLAVCTACLEGLARGEPTMATLLDWGFRPSDWLDTPCPPGSGSDLIDLTGNGSHNGHVNGESNGHTQLSWSFSPAGWGDS
jgi:hypothetical protein